MNDPEDDYYTRKQRRAEETAALYMKVTFYIVLFCIGYGLGVLVGNLG